jgi:Family of unknown function (DUF6155)
MGIKDLKSELEILDKKNLIELISEIYRKDKNVQEFFEYYLKPDETKLFEKYKTQVREGFYPKRGDALRLSVARQAISNFKKFEPSKELLADLMLYYVECGVEFTNDFGDINESFYTSIAAMFRSALDLISREGNSDRFKERATKIVRDSDGIGWGFSDDVGDCYHEYYD